LGADQGLWLQRLRTEFGNLREALSWSLEPGEHAQELRLRLAAALCRFWEAQSFEEGKRWLRKALEKDPGGFPAVRAKALGGLGFILLFQQDYGAAISALEEAIVLHEELGDESGVALALANLGYTVVHGGYRERVPTFVEQGEALMQEGNLEGHPRAYLRIVLACTAAEEGDLDSAVAQLEEVLALCRELGTLWDTGAALVILGMIELLREHLDRGAALLEEAARLARELKDRMGSAYSVWLLGKVAFLRGRPVQAAKLWGAAEALREQMSMSLSRLDLALSGYEQDLAAVRSTLFEASFEAAFSEGRAMSPEQAIEYALGAVEGPAAAPPTTMAPVAPERTSSGEKPPGTAEAKATTIEGLRIFALGPTRVEKGGRPLDSSSDWSQKPRELLYYLLSHPEGRTKEQIGLALWPEASTAQLRSSFHDTIYRLRRALGGKEWISFQKGRYAFERSLPYSFDVEAFEESVSEAQRVQAQAPEQAIRHLQEAAGLYRGDFLDSAAEDGEWAMARQEELRREYQEALLLLGGLLLAENHPAEAAAAYRKAVAHDGLLEEAHRGLMRCYAALGERGRSLRHYEALVELLDEQLGTAPAPETSVLYERLRAGEEA
jgi:two-component SAPR family response regulator